MMDFLLLRPSGVDFETAVWVVVKLLIWVVVSVNMSVSDWTLLNHFRLCFAHVAMTFKN